MDWIIIGFFALLGVSAILIILTIASLPQLGDERKNFVKMKAQSYSFTVVIGMLIIEIAESVYLTIWGNGSYTGISPITFLLAISVVYLVTLVIYKRKFGG